MVDVFRLNHDLLHINKQVVIEEVNVGIQNLWVAIAEGKNKNNTHEHKNLRRSFKSWNTSTACFHYLRITIQVQE